MNNQNISNFVVLAEASYADFSKRETADDDNLQKVMKDEKMPERLAKYVTDNYEMVTHWQDRAQGMIDVANKESGFSGTLFKNKTTGEYVLGFKNINDRYANDDPETGFSANAYRGKGS